MNAAHAHRFDRAPAPALPAATPEALAGLGLLRNPVWVFDIDVGRMAWANAAAVRMWGADSLEVLLARDFCPSMSEATRTRLRAYQRAFADGALRKERWTFYPNGQPCVVDCDCSGVILAGGRIGMLVEGRILAPDGVDPDTLRMVEALRHTGAMVSLYATDGTPLLRNPAAIRVYGEAHGADPLWSLFADTRAGERLRAELAQGRAFGGETPMRTAAGPRWHALDARTTTDPATGDAAILVNETDVEERIRAERQVAEDRDALRRASDDLARSNAELEQFAYVASHDLRQPLRTIASFLTLLERHLQDTLDEDGREFLGFARGGAQRLDRMIVDLLEYSRVGRKLRQSEPVPLADAVAEALLDLEAAVADADAEVRVEPGLPTVSADRTEMVRLFLNLIGNALKYRAAGRRPVVRIGADCHGARWRISVADNGIGIAPEHHERIFGVFQRLHGRDAYEGTGIGLAICRKIASRHGGWITVSSQDGEGSVFTVELPADDAGSPADPMADGED